MSHMRELRKETQVPLPTSGEKYVAADGTVSMVLDEQLDTSYEPTEEEIMEFAEWLGMKFPEDEEYLWIATEGLKTPLPKEWKPCQTDTGEIYYFNFKTGDSVWDHPMDEHVRSKFVEEKERRRKLRESGVVITDARQKIPQRNNIIFSENGIIVPSAEEMPPLSLETNRSEAEQMEASPRDGSGPAGGASPPLSLEKTSPALSQSTSKNVEVRTGAPTAKISIKGASTVDSSRTPPAVIGNKLGAGHTAKPAHHASVSFVTGLAQGATASVAPATATSKSPGSQPVTIISAMTGKPIAVGNRSTPAVTGLSSSLEAPTATSTTPKSSALAVGSSAPTGSLLSAVGLANVVPGGAAPVSSTATPVTSELQTHSILNSTSATTSSILKNAQASGGPRRAESSPGQGASSVTGSILSLVNGPATASPAPQLGPATQGTAPVESGAVASAAPTSVSPVSTGASLAVGSTTAGSPSPTVSPKVAAARSPTDVGSTAPQKRFASEAERNLEARLTNEIEVSHRVELEAMAQTHQAKLRVMEEAHRAALASLEQEWATREAHELQVVEQQQRQKNEQQWARMEADIKAKIDALLAEERQIEEKIRCVGETFDAKQQKELADLSSKLGAEVAKQVREVQTASEKEKLAITRKINNARSERLRELQHAHFEEMKHITEASAEKIAIAISEMQRDHASAKKRLCDEAQTALATEREAMEARSEQSLEQSIQALREKLAAECASIARQAASDQERLSSELAAELEQFIKKEESLLAGLRDQGKPQTSSPEAELAAVECTAGTRLEELHREYEAQKREAQRSHQQRKEQRAEERRKRAAQEMEFAIRTAKKEGEVQAEQLRDQLAREEQQLKSEAEQRLLQATSVSGTQAIEDAVEADFKAFVSQEESLRNQRLRDTAATKAQMEAAAWESALKELMLERETKAAQLGDASRTQPELPATVVHRSATEQEVRERCQSPVRRATMQLELSMEKDLAAEEQQIRDRFEGELQVRLVELTEEVASYEDKEQQKIEREIANLRNSDEERSRASAAPQLQVGTISHAELEKRLRSIRLEYEAREQKLGEDALRQPLGDRCAKSMDREGLCSASLLSPLPRTGAVLESPSLFRRSGEAHRRSASASDTARYLSDRQELLAQRRAHLQASREEWERDLRNASGLGGTELYTPPIFPGSHEEPWVNAQPESYRRAHVPEGEYRGGRPPKDSPPTWDPPPRSTPVMTGVYADPLVSFDSGGFDISRMARRGGPLPLRDAGIVYRTATDSGGPQNATQSQLLSIVERLSHRLEDLSSIVMGGEQ